MATRSASTCSVANGSSLLRVARGVALPWRSPCRAVYRQAGRSLRQVPGRPSSRWLIASIRYNRRWGATRADELSVAPVLLVTVRIFFLSSHHSSGARQP